MQELLANIKLNKFIVLGLCLIFLSVAVKAELLGNCSATIYPDTPITRTITLINSSDKAQDFEIKIIGEKAHWINIHQSQANPFLEPGQETKIFAFIEAPYYESIGKEEIYIKGIGSKGTQYAIGCNLELTTGHKIELNLSETAIESTECQKKLIEIELRNSGVFGKEEIELKIDGIPAEWHDLEEKSFSLDTNQTKKVGLELLLPCSAEAGLYAFNVVAEIPSHGLSFKEKVVLELNQSQFIGIGVEEKLFACRDKEEEFLFTVSNNGSKEDEITLSVEGPDWVEIADSNISLDANKSKQVVLRTKENTGSEGLYKATLKAVSGNFFGKTSKTISIESKDCYNLDIEKIGEKNACIEENPNYLFKLTNDREETINVTASIDGIGNDLGSKSFSIKPNETQLIEAELFSTELSDDLAGTTLPFTFNVSAEHFSTSKNYSLEVEDCFNAELIVEDFNLCKCIASKHFIELKNTGSKETWFELQALPLWAKLPEKVLLAAGKTAVIDVNALVPCSTESKNIVFSVFSKHIAVSKTASANYGSPESCYSLEIVLEKTEVLSEVEGKAMTVLRIANNSGTKQSISIDLTNKEIFYVAPAEFELDNNQAQDVFIYASLANDSNELIESTFINISSDLGFGRVQELVVNFEEKSIDIVSDVNKTDEGKEGTGLTGLFSLGGIGTLKNGLIFLLVLIIIALIIFALLPEAKEDEKLIDAVKAVNAGTTETKTRKKKK